MERTTHFQGKVEQPHWQRERDRKRWCKNHQDKQTRRRFKVSVGIAGKQVINRRTAGQDHSSRVKDNQILLERETMSNASQGGGKKSKSKDAGALVWNQQAGSPVASSVASFHHRRKQAQQLVRLTRLNAQRWICARPQ